MATPKYKIYSADGEYVAAVRYAEDAACLVGSLYHGGTVRFDHAKKTTVWTEGREEFSACDSYDGAARIMHQREREIQAKAYAKFCSENGVTPKGNYDPR